MNSIEVKLQTLASACLVDLDALLLPLEENHLEIAAQRAELLEAGVPLHRIETLYPMDLRPYASGADRLCEREDLYWEMTGEQGDATIEAIADAYDFFPSVIREAKEAAVQEADVEAGSNPLRLVAFAHLLAYHPLSSLDPEYRFNSTVTAATVELEYGLGLLSDFVRHLNHWVQAPQSS